MVNLSTKIKTLFRLSFFMVKLKMNVTFSIMDTTARNILSKGYKYINIALFKLNSTCAFTWIEIRNKYLKTYLQQKKFFIRASRMQITVTNLILILKYTLKLTFSYILCDTELIKLPTDLLLETTSAINEIPFNFQK